jgi:hypothetical protein
MRVSCLGFFFVATSRLLWIVAPGHIREIIPCWSGETRPARDRSEPWTMSRWQELVDNLLTDLETETPGPADLRVNIDHKIWEAEQTVSYAVPTTPHETTVRRLHDFQRELIETLSKQLKNDPANEILLEARSLLENPWFRVPEHRRPDLR